MDYLAIRSDNPAEYDSHPKDVAQYQKAAFWDQRYIENPEVFEWYHPYDAFVDIFDMFLDLGDDILNLGCGNSEMSADMTLEGYVSITNIDFSQVVIDQMRDKYLSKFPDMSWFYMDALKLKFPDGHFDVVIDKGCFDSVLCGDKGQLEARLLLQEIDRVLKDDGAYILISNGLPDVRLPLLENDDIVSCDFLTWDTFVNAIAKPTADQFTVPDYGNLDSMYYVYVCIKEERKVNLKRRRDNRRRREAKKKGRIEKGKITKKQEIYL